MSWNYRVIREPNDDTESGDWLTIREVYYNPDDSIKLYSAEPDSVGAENLEDLRFNLQSMLKALDRPVIDFKDLPTGK